MAEDFLNQIKNFQASNLNSLHFSLPCYSQAKSSLLSSAPNTTKQRLKKTSLFFRFFQKNPYNYRVSLRGLSGFARWLKYSVMA